MRRAQTAILLAFASFSCQQEAAQPASPPPAPVKAPAPKEAPAPVVAAVAAPKRLPFEIVTVYRDQTTSSAPPWHTKGGDWTFFDAKTPGGATFTVGIPPRLPHSPKSLAFDQMLIATGDRTGATRLVDEWAKAFGVAAPQAGPEKPVRALQVMTVTLTDNAERNPNGDFGGVGGGWSSTKWTVETGGESADVYFNYNLGAKQGEWAEKDADSNPMFVAKLAKIVRDGDDAK